MCTCTPEQCTHVTVASIKLTARSHSRRSKNNCVDLYKWIISMRLAFCNAFTCPQEHNIARYSTRYMLTCIWLHCRCDLKRIHLPGFIFWYGNAEWTSRAAWMQNDASRIEYVEHLCDECAYSAQCWTLLWSRLPCTDYHWPIKRVVVVLFWVCVELRSYCAYQVRAVWRTNCIWFNLWNSANKHGYAFMNCIFLSTNSVNIF